MRISALHPHLPFRASRGCRWYPLIFTGAGRASQSSFPQEAGGVLKMRPAFATIARRRPASGSCCRGQAERALMRHHPAALAMDAPVRVSRASAHANPAMGFCWLLSGVSDAVSAARAFARCSSSNRGTPPIAAAVPFAGLPSARGFSGELLQDVRSGSSLLSIELQRRHPCRRRPFSVFGRFAPSSSERSRSSHCR